MIDEIYREALRRRITRLCHFTPSRNLLHIASGGTGILSTRSLKEAERLIYNPTDLERLDNHENYICCSIQYPNPWYFQKARSSEPLFLDWVVLLINPHYLWLKGTCFCPRNAAAGSGRMIGEGIDVFKSLFADSVEGAYGKKFIRSSSRLPSCPTDDQAEVLISDCVTQNDIIAFAVQSEEQAKRECERLRLIGVNLNQLRVIIAPLLFDKDRLSATLKSGQCHSETEWSPEV